MLTGTIRTSVWSFVGTAAREVSFRHCTCPGVASTASTTQLHRKRLILAPCAASAADRPHGHGSRAPKLPPLRRIRSPTLSAEDAEQQTPADVDQDLWEVLDLCTIEELEELHGILFGASPLSPVVKSIVTDSEPAAAHVRGRVGLMRRIEARFRFLAADANAMLRGRRPSYRESLLSVRDRLKVQCPSTLATQDLEAEVFLHMMRMWTESKAAASQQEAEALMNAYAVAGDKKAPPRQQFGGRGLGQALEQLAAPLKLGSTEFVPLLAKLGSALSLSSVQRTTLQNLGIALLRSRVQYDAAVHAAVRGAAASSATRQAALRVLELLHHPQLQASQHGLTSAAARYGAARGMLSVLGPAMWALFAGELAVKSIGTDYGRVVRAMYTLAQVRMVSTYGWSTPRNSA